MLSIKPDKNNIILGLLFLTVGFLFLVSIRLQLPFLITTVLGCIWTLLITVFADELFNK